MPSASQLVFDLNHQENTTVFKFIEHQKMLRATILLCVVSALCRIVSAQLCSGVQPSGCAGTGPDLGTFLVSGILPFNCAGEVSIGGTDICDRNVLDFTVAGCQAGDSGLVPATQNAYCNDWFAGCCSVLVTIAPTLAPSLSPTAAPSQSPTLPTPMPTNAPSESPTKFPTDAPSTMPTAAPVTPQPTKQELGFFDIEENIYIVAGAGGGGLLLAAIALGFLVRRNRSGSDAAVVSSNSTGGTGANVAPEDIFDWEKHIDKKSGEVYFFNPKTGESRWDPPPVKGI